MRKGTQRWIAARMERQQTGRFRIGHISCHPASRGQFLVYAATRRKSNEQDPGRITTAWRHALTRVAQEG